MPSPRVPGETAAVLRELSMINTAEIGVSSVPLSGIALSRFNPDNLGSAGSLMSVGRAKVRSSCSLIF
ncbi:hypothetical protein AMJ80_00780 [bacterium SM23_31]|nr:MAG: hypothetical protein AMJ80_00780 [bacterium SM23_31]